MSPLPSPWFPWHIAQSMPYIFLPLASDSAVGLTGFALAASSGGILDSGVAAFSGGGFFFPPNSQTPNNNAEKDNASFFFYIPPQFLRPRETINKKPTAPTP